jgi:hypothetical protein
MSKSRLASVLSVTVIVFVLAAAILNYFNTGRITWKAVGGFLFFVSVALVVRTVVAGNGGTSAGTDQKTTK